jgi:hypothetical protein
MFWYAGIADGFLKPNMVEYQYTPLLGRDRTYDRVGE